MGSEEMELRKIGIRNSKLTVVLLDRLCNLKGRKSKKLKMAANVL
jgi:hypothetical protein